LGGATLEEFKVKFNSNKQYINVFVYDVHPTTFERWNGTYWAYFEPTWTNPKDGEFGQLHMVKSGIREDTVAHELFHVLCEFVWANRDAITGKNEEKYAELFDSLIRNFYREYRKLEK
jgi:hypothetical protein